MTSWERAEGVASLKEGISLIEPLARSEVFLRPVSLSGETGRSRFEAWLAAVSRRDPPRGRSNGGDAKTGGQGRVSARRRDPDKQRIRRDSFASGLPGTADGPGLPGRPVCALSGLVITMWPPQPTSHSQRGSLGVAPPRSTVILRPILSPTACRWTWEFRSPKIYDGSLRSWMSWPGSIPRKPHLSLGSVGGLRPWSSASHLASSCESSRMGLRDGRERFQAGVGLRVLGTALTRTGPFRNSTPVRCAMVGAIRRLFDDHPVTGEYRWRAALALIGLGLTVAGCDGTSKSASETRRSGSEPAASKSPRRRNGYADSRIR